MKQAFENSKKGICTFTCILLLVIITNGCIDNTASEQINVIVTIIPQKEMVDAIGGQFVSVTTLVPEGQNPHTYEPTPSQLMKVSQSKAYFIVGSGVEFELVHLDTIVEQNNDLKIVDCSNHINVISFDEHYRKEHYNETNSEEHSDQESEQDHTHTGTDPHIWTSPENYKKMAKAVYNGLIEIDPGHQEAYYTNYQGYTAEIDALHTNISILLQPYEGKSFMVYHPSWGYFGDTYHLKQIAIEDNGKQPGPAGIAAIIEQANRESINVIFVAPQFDTSSAEIIADEINGKVVFANPLMNNYQETMQLIASEMQRGFQDQAS